MSKLTLTVLGFVGFLLLSVSAKFGLPQGLLIATSWKTAPGQVVDYKEWPTSADSPGRAADTYEFTVNGKTFRNQGLRPFRRFHSLTCRLLDQFLPRRKSMVWVDNTDTPEYMRANYPVGKTVTVYYDPSDPSTSVLEPLRNPTEFWRMYFPNGQFWYKGDSK